MSTGIGWFLGVVLLLTVPTSAWTLQANRNPPDLAVVVVAEAVPVEGGLLVQRGGPPPVRLSWDRIAALPHLTQRVSVTTAQGERQNDWSGPLLWDVLGASGLIEGLSPRDQAHLAVRITGADGYAAVVSFGEISPQLANRPLLLADELNGASLPGHALRLIVPGDRLGARSVRDVVRLNVD